MQRDLNSFPIPPSVHVKLTKSGFSLVDDVCNMTPLSLSKEADITPHEALAVLDLVKPTTVVGSNMGQSISAYDLLQKESDLGALVTFSHAIDSMLGTGVPVGKITEFCGAPGVGKTQMCIQLCIDVHIPESLGGLSGEAVYIDTEGSFIIDRVVDIANATIKHCQLMAPEDEDLCSLNLESVLAGIHYFRCLDYVELMALVHTLPDFLKQHSKVRLIVVDSIAFHFRHDFDDMSLRTRLLNGLAQSFIRMASQFNLAIVLTNQMTTKISHDSSKQSHLIPALGESWGHAATIRVILYWKDQQRYATLYKSPSKAEKTVPYQVTADGIRDIVTVNEQDEEEEDSETLPTTLASPPTKRCRYKK